MIDLNIYKVKDDLKSTVDCITKSLKECDYLLISGGISVGDYDFVEKALELNEVDCHFYKVAQKPGKPLWFGTKENKYVFALPGNPVSALFCMRRYVIPSLRKSLKLKRENFKVILDKDVFFKKDFTFF